LNLQNSRESLRKWHNLPFNTLSNFLYLELHDVYLEYFLFLFDSFAPFLRGDMKVSHSCSFEIFLFNVKNMLPTDFKFQSKFWNLFTLQFGSCVCLPSG